MKTNLNNFCLFFILLVSMPLSMQAKEVTSETIKCQTPNAEKTFIIRHEKGRIRKIASTKNSLIKTLSENGIKQEIHIEDTGHFDETNDFLTLTSSLGYRMTYSLKCQKNKS